MTEIRLQEDNIAENANVRSPLTLKNLLLVDAYMQIQKLQRKLERRFV